MIVAKELVKEYKIYQHRRGFFGAVRNMFSTSHTIVRAVDQISFRIAAGELVGYLGPNGAGKSTTIKMLTGILVPTSGELTIGGIVPWRERVKHARRMGVVFGQRTTLWWDLPVIETMDLLRTIYKIPQQQYRRNLEMFTDLLGLSEFLNTPVRSLSLGQRMRADLAVAFLHDPEIVFLDEPTIGLDVLAKERIRQFIATINCEKKTTVILTTHDLGDVAKLCRRVMMIDHGKVLFDGVLAELVSRFGGERRLVVDFAEEYDDQSIAGARIIAKEGRKVTYAFHSNGNGVAPLIEDLSRKYKWADISLQDPDVETTIRRIYEQWESDHSATRLPC